MPVDTNSKSSPAGIIFGVLAAVLVIVLIVVLANNSDSERGQPDANASTGAAGDRGPTELRRRLTRRFLPRRTGP